MFELILADEPEPAVVKIEPESKGLLDYNNRSENVSNGRDEF